MHQWLNAFNPIKKKIKIAYIEMEHGTASPDGLAHNRQ